MSILGVISESRRQVALLIKLQSLEEGRLQQEHAEQRNKQFHQELVEALTHLGIDAQIQPSRHGPYAVVEGIILRPVEPDRQSPDWVQNEESGLSPPLRFMRIVGPSGEMKEVKYINFTLAVLGDALRKVL